MFCPCSHFIYLNSSMICPVYQIRRWYTAQFTCIVWIRNYITFWIRFHFICCTKNIQSSIIFNRRRVSHKILCNQWVISNHTFLFTKTFGQLQIIRVCILFFRWCVRVIAFFLTGRNCILDINLTNFQIINIYTIGWSFKKQLSGCRRRLQIIQQLNFTTSKSNLVIGVKYIGVRRLAIINKPASESFCAMISSFKHYAKNFSFIYIFLQWKLKILSILYMKCFRLWIIRTSLTGIIHPACWKVYLFISFRHIRRRSLARLCRITRFCLGCIILCRRRRHCWCTFCLPRIFCGLRHFRICNICFFRSLRSSNFHFTFQVVILLFCLYLSYNNCRSYFLSRNSNFVLFLFR